MEVSLNLSLSCSEHYLVDEMIARSCLGLLMELTKLGCISFDVPHWFPVPTIHNGKVLALGQTQGMGD